MKTPKHTPGPWTILATHDPAMPPVGQHLSPRLRLVCDTGTATQIVAVVATRPDGSNIAQEQANARLIAAAPELLEALQLAQSILGTLLQSDSGTYSAGQEKINAAIAKATE